MVNVCKNLMSGRKECVFSVCNIEGLIRVFKNQYQ